MITSARSFVYDFGNAVSVNRIELFPDSYTHRVRERDIRLYYRESENSDWSEIKKLKFTKNEKNGSLTFALSEAVSARQIKVHCTWDDRNFLNVSIDTKATFNGNPVNLLRIWTLEESRIEDYEYDGNSGRKSLIENGVTRNYEYYKNENNGNTARVMSDGKWWYTYDENGNRTARGYNENPDSGEVSIDKTKEYWTYTWDLWNRLIEVRQFNAPDNAENVHVEYTYDVQNHRIERVSRTKSTVETTQYAYGRNGAMTYQKKTAGSSVTTRSFVYLNNQIAGFMDTEQGTETIRYAVTDIQGSVTEVYDEDNKLLWKSGYTAFGIKAGETTNLIDFAGLYTGCDFDAETGLTNHWNRWRGEDGSNWLTQDPVRDGVNWYGYCSNNPLRFVDPDGNEIVNAARTLMKTGNKATLGSSKELIKDVGCVLTAYTRMASSIIGGEEVSLVDANKIAIDNDLFTNGNELTPENGAKLVNAILKENGITDTTVSFDGTYKGDDAINKYKDTNSSTEGKYFATVRVNTHDTEGNKYDHTMNLDADAYSENACGGANLKVNDTSGVRTQLVDDPSGRKNTFIKMDFFKINSTAGDE